MPIGTKSLPEPMLNSHWWISVAFTREQFHNECPSHYMYFVWVWKNYTSNVTPHCPRGQWVNSLTFSPSPSNLPWPWYGGQWDTTHQLWEESSTPICRNPASCMDIAPCSSYLKFEYHNITFLLMLLALNKEQQCSFCLWRSTLEPMIWPEGWVQMGL